MKYLKLYESKQIISVNDLLNYEKILNKIKDANRIAKRYLEIYPEKITNSNINEWYIGATHWNKSYFFIEIQDSDYEKIFQTISVPIDEFVDFWNNPEKYEDAKNTIYKL